jgi:hypothetical protein
MGLVDYPIKKMKKIITKANTTIAKVKVTVNTKIVHIVHLKQFRCKKKIYKNNNIPQRINIKFIKTSHLICKYKNNKLISIQLLNLNFFLAREDNLKIKYRNQSIIILISSQKFAQRQCYNMKKKYKTI